MAHDTIAFQNFSKNYILNAGDIKGASHSQGSEVDLPPQSSALASMSEVTPLALAAFASKILLVTLVLASAHTKPKLRHRPLMPQLELIPNADRDHQWFQRR